MSGPGPAGPDPAGPDPAGPDPAVLDPAGDDPAGPDPAVLDPAGDGPVRTRLRAVRDEERAVLARWAAESTSEFEDFGGPPPPGVLAVEQVPLPAGSGTLAVVDGQDRLLGSVGWHPVLYGPNAGSQALDIGIALHPSAWGRGHGSRAQRMLAELLLATTRLNRVQASTDVRNTAEQRALARAGFLLEGVLRGAQWRRGQWHDLACFARLRSDR